MLELNTESINQNVLGKIVAEKIKWLKERKEKEPLNSFLHTLTPSTRSLKHALTSHKTNFIMECKKASPSKGLIRPDFHPAEIASTYRYYAQAISVLAEEHFFQGNMSYISVVRGRVKVPVICKDFIIDPYQVYLARKYGADAILLMLSVLPDESYRILAGVAEKLGLDVLTETSNPEEVQRAINLNAKIVGINNRNLRDLTVDLNRTKELAPLIPDDRVKVCESGIYTNDDVKDLAPYVNAFLVGSSLTSEPDINMACRRLVYGNNKVCGLTRHQDVLDVAHAGATYGGLIFAEHSKRKVSVKHAKKMIKGVDLKMVGVFVDQDADFIENAAKELHLAAVQLHGKENSEFITKLREKLPKYTEIWKAVAVSESEFSKDVLADVIPVVDRILLDTKSHGDFGGTGTTFNWKIIDDLVTYAVSLDKTKKISNEEKIKNFRARLIVAGGLNGNNANEARNLGVYALDFNSGVESMPGIKDQEKLKAAFSSVRDY